ncbi:glycosyltransferase [Spirosoma taeanense]|uniref:Glycosyltransferase n=1 Tax=Spirosoma taeanense TaxID=2735870 RepID=A0A6M5Y4P3_9BACT|nr:glycosyltransferase [Spirosoma taeanense]QJW88755.1 glycosyltransferase [Spirosoma taeanense]
MSVTATVILPTTADRGALLPFCVGSVLRQTVADLELFIIGDGVSDATRSVIHELMGQDARIRFFDQPKHERRGEEYRHQALQTARGRIVAYLCDRDLWLPHHLQTLDNQLQDATLATTAFYSVREDGRMVVPFRPTQSPDKTFVNLSAVGHTLDSYHQLPYGWRTTPTGVATDWYMWQQMLAQPDCRPVIHWAPTLLYFKRGDHPGWTVAQRQAELSHWFAQLQVPAQLQPALDQAIAQAVYERNRLKESWLSVKGRSPGQLPGWIRQKIQGWLGSSATAEAEEIDWPDRIKLDR